MKTMPGEYDWAVLQTSLSITKVHKIQTERTILQTDIKHKTCIDMTEMQCTISC